jgi:hypothetical protein
MLPATTTFQAGSKKEGGSRREEALNSSALEKSASLWPYCPEGQIPALRRDELHESPTSTPNRDKLGTRRARPSELSICATRPYAGCHALVLS